MKDFNFNMYAMISPRTQKEISAVLDEAIRMAKEIDEMWTEMFRQIEKE